MCTIPLRIPDIDDAGPLVHFAHNQAVFQMKTPANRQPRTVITPFCTLFYRAVRVLTDGQTNRRDRFYSFSVPVFRNKTIRIISHLIDRHNLHIKG